MSFTDTTIQAASTGVYRDDLWHMPVCECPDSPALCGGPLTGAEDEHEAGADDCVVCLALHAADPYFYCERCC